MGKKILLVAEYSPESFSLGCFHALVGLGHTVHKFEYTQRTSLSHLPSSKIGFIISRINDFFINKRLIATVKKDAPDLIFLIKAHTIHPKTLRALKTITQAPIINWYPDNPFTFWNGVSNAHILRSLPLYDAFITWSHLFVDPLRSAGCRNVLYAPFGYDESLYEQSPALTDEDRLKYTSEVSFIGSWEKDRQWWLEELCAQMPAIDLAIWGTGWEELLPAASPLHKYLRGYTSEMIKIFKLSKISLNFIRTPNMHSHNMRTMEIPASGGFQLTQRTPEQAVQLFQESDSIACFATPAELVAKIEYFLQNPELRQSVVTNAAQQVKKYRLSTIIRQMLEQTIFGE